MQNHYTLDSKSEKSREKKPSASSGDRFISFRVTSEQQERINELAAKCGIDRSRYILMRCLCYEPRLRLTAEQEAAVNNLMGCRTDLLNFVKALRGMKPEKRQEMFNNLPFMYDWTRHLGEMYNILGDFIDLVNGPNKVSNQRFKEQSNGGQG